MRTNLSPVQLLLIEPDDSDAERFAECVREVDNPCFRARNVPGIEAAIPIIGRDRVHAVVASVGEALRSEDLRTICLLAPDTPILVFASVVDTRTAIRLLHSGAQDYLIKEDLKPAMLRHVVLTAIERQRHVTEWEECQAKRQRELERLALMDELTGLHNRRHMRDRLIQEVFRAERYGSPLSLLMLDLDHFKKVNDTHGHLVGDEALVMAASLIKRQIRGTDIAARYGGEEFCVILTETGMDGALELAEKIRAAMESARIDGPGNQPLGVTCSLGVSSYEKGVTDTLMLIKHADQALYAAKREGRNCVRAWREEAVSV